MCSGCFNCMLTRFGTNAIQGYKEEFEMGINMSYDLIVTSSRNMYDTDGWR